MNIYFNDSKYTKWYYGIVNNAISQNRSKKDEHYYERHHIIPASIGGSNQKSNLVLLTYKEHFICHRLLLKMCLNKQHTIKMAKAFFKMICVNDQQERNPTSRMIKIAKEQASLAQSERWQDEEFREKAIASMNTPECKVKQSLRSKNAWQTPEYRNLMLEIMQEVNLRPETKEKRSKSQKIVQNRSDIKEKNRLGVKKSWEDPEKRKIRIENMTKASNTPEARKNNSEAQLRPEVIDKKRDSLAKTNALPEIKEKRSNAQKEVMARPGQKEKLIEALKTRNEYNRLICPHCLKNLDPMNAKKWHFDRCKKRVDINSDP